MSGEWGEAVFKKDFAKGALFYLFGLVPLWKFAFFVI